MRFGYDAVTGHPNASTELESVFSFIEPSRAELVSTWHSSLNGILEHDGQRLVFFLREKELGRRRRRVSCFAMAPPSTIVVPHQPLHAKLDIVAETGCMSGTV